MIYINTLLHQCKIYGCTCTKKTVNKGKQMNKRLYLPKITSQSNSYKFFMHVVLRSRSKEQIQYIRSEPPPPTHRTRTNYSSDLKTQVCTKEQNSSFPKLIIFIYCNCFATSYEYAMRNENKIIYSIYFKLFLVNSRFVLQKTMYRSF